MSLIVIFILILAILIGIRIILNIDMITIKELAKNEKLNTEIEKMKKATFWQRLFKQY